MPLVRPYGDGGAATVSPPCNLRRRIVLAADAAVVTSSLLVEGMPNLFLWAKQTTGGALATMEWQWTARPNTDLVNAVPGDDWQLLFTAAQTPLAAGNAEVYYNRTLSAKKIRLQLTRSPGIATTVEIFFGGTAT